MRLFIFLTLLAGIVTASAQGQSNAIPGQPEDDPLVPLRNPPFPDWYLSAGATAIRVSELNGWGNGPTALVACFVSDRAGIEFGPTVILGSSGFYDFRGLSADLGAVYQWWASDFDFDLAAGPSMLAGSDSDGTFLAFGGGYAALRTTYWPFGTPGPGFFARGSIRLWHTGDVSPAATAGVAFRL